MYKGIAFTLDIDTPLKNIGFKTLLIAITLLNSSATLVRPEFKVFTLVIDPGHGGHDPGTRGDKVLEKDIALKISLKLGAYIEKNIPGVQSNYTRKEDRYVALDERAIMANKNKADLFICIHANAITNAKAYGTETYVMGLSKDESNFEVANGKILLSSEMKTMSNAMKGLIPVAPNPIFCFHLLKVLIRKAA